MSKSFKSPERSPEVARAQQGRLFRVIHGTEGLQESLLVGDPDLLYEDVPKPVEVDRVDQGELLQTAVPATVINAVRMVEEQEEEGLNAARKRVQESYDDPLAA